MTEENLQTSAEADDDADATVVKPFFDEAATETARPVVPLPAHPASPFALSSYTPRTWVIALVVVSALIGGVLGGIGLSLYQKTRISAASAPNEQPATGETTSSQTTVEPAQASSTTERTNEAQAQTPTQTATIATVSDQTGEATAPQPSAVNEAVAEDVRTTEIKKSNEALKSASDDDRDEDEGKRAERRGKGRGDDDEREQQRVEQRRRAERNAEPVRAARPEHARGEPTAYRVDSYVVKERRARREARQQRIEQQPRDRVRAIFEGPTP
ncbi:MAG TPA: hypothetical protein VGB73_18140 [Pyrinomonadaceae bacterium]|jgi:hypothetical protein